MPTINTVELSELDLRYESYRIKHSKREERLLLSILKSGIRDPLRGVRTGETNCLLDGFKRMRCAKKLSIAIVPYHSLGNDEAMGIIDFMRESFSQKLNVIEQIKLIDALKTAHGFSNNEIATYLDKSNSWVSIRVAMNRELSPLVTRHILSGKFPARSFLYSVLPFTRVNKTKKEEIDRFVDRVAGNHFTTRDIDQLAEGYFKGTSALREQIENGNPKWALECLKNHQKEEKVDCTSAERSVLQGLEMVRTGMLKINNCPHDSELKSSAFLAQANLLTKGILDDRHAFLELIRRLYDRSQ